MRKHSTWGVERNARLDSWFRFLSLCNGNYGVKFIAIGMREEIDPRLRALGNVIFSKDFGTTIEQDLALMQSSLMYLGSTSGPGVMAALSDRPYIIFNYRPSHTRLPFGSQHPFATSLQKLVWEPETAELLIHGFEDLFSQIDCSRWAQEFDRLVLESTGLLRRDTGQSNLRAASKLDPQTVSQ